MLLYWYTSGQELHGTQDTLVVGPTTARRRTARPEQRGRRTSDEEPRPATAAS